MPRPLHSAPCPSFPFLKLVQFHGECPLRLFVDVRVRLGYENGYEHLESIGVPVLFLESRVGQKGG